MSVRLVDGKYRYFAFISYTHADYKEAKRLYKRLQHYSLPNRLMRRGDCVKRLVPVFLDYSGLYGKYREADMKALKESKYLIVVCSKKLKNHDVEVNREISDFLDAGNPVDHIIPFNIECDESPEANCFPEKLREICRKDNIIAHNIYEPSGKRNYHNALLKTVAQMQELEVVELENEDYRRRRKRVIGRVLATVFLLAFLAGLGFYFSTTRFSSGLELKTRLVGMTGWEDELHDIRAGDVVEVQVEFINDRGPLSRFLYLFGENNNLSITTDNIMIRSVLPDNMEYISSSTTLYNANYPEGVRLKDNTITTTGINIGNYTINGNAYVRFNCVVVDKSLQKGGNKLIIWASSTIDQVVEKDSVSIWIYK